MASPRHIPSFTEGESRAFTAREFSPEMLIHRRGIEIHAFMHHMLHELPCLARAVADNLANLVKLAESAKLAELATLAELAELTKLAKLAKSE